MQVKEIMTLNPAVCEPATPIQDVAFMMVEHDCGAIPVVDSLDSKRPVGIITDRDVVVRLIANGKNPLDVKVQDCLTAPVIAVSADEDVHEVVEMMKEHQIRRLVVLDNQHQVCGIVAQADIAKMATEEEVVEVVREVSYPAGASLI